VTALKAEGVWPLVNARGAGAASRQALGTAVFGGMLASTLLAVFVVPVFFVIFQWLSEFKPLGRGDKQSAESAKATPEPEVATAEEPEPAMVHRAIVQPAG